MAGKVEQLRLERRRRRRKSKFNAARAARKSFPTSGGAAQSFPWSSSSRTPNKLYKLAQSSADNSFRKFFASLSSLGGEETFHAASFSCSCVN